MGWTDHIQQQHSDVTKQSNRVTEPVYQVEPLRAFCDGTGSVGETELRDRNEHRVPERQIARNTERAAERLSRSQRCRCTPCGLCRNRQKDCGPTNGALRLPAGRSSLTDSTQLSRSQFDLSQ